MPIRLIPASAGEAIKLDKPVLLIGRNPDCDVVLTASRKVSRNHCLIACVDDKLFIRDLGSTNGVWINGHRVEREGRIRAGDELSIADLKYAVRQVDRNGAAKAEPQEKPSVRQSVSDEHDAGGRRVRKVGVSAPVDGDQPVAIPEEDDSFVVEASAPRLPRVRPDEIEAEVVREPSPRKRRAEGRPAEPLELDEPLNLDLPLDLGQIRDADLDSDDDAREPAAGNLSDSTNSAEMIIPGDPPPDAADSAAWLSSGSDDDYSPIIPLDD
ncbi:FHA domain-containing protein [bacterium]|nr:FHA domain-containing protein [bacterium]